MDNGTPIIQILGFGYSKEEADQKFALASDVNGIEEELQKINEGGVE